MGVRGRIGGLEGGGLAGLEGNHLVAWSLVSKRGFDGYLCLEVGVVDDLAYEYCTMSGRVSRCCCCRCRCCCCCAGECLKVGLSCIGRSKHDGGATLENVPAIVRQAGTDVVESDAHLGEMGFVLAKGTCK